MSGNADSRLKSKGLTPTIFLYDAGLANNDSQLKPRPGIYLPENQWRFLVSALDIHPHYIEQFHNKYIGGYATFTTLGQDDRPEAFRETNPSPTLRLSRANMYKMS